MQRQKQSVFAVAAAAGLALVGYTAQAGSVTYNFDTDPTTGASPIAVYQTGFANEEGAGVYWKNAGGNPDTGGFFGLTWPMGSSTTIAVFPDLDPGNIVTAFKLECDLRLGNPQQSDRAADGFSINFARSTDEIFSASPPSASNFATSGAVETGAKTGIAVIFDTWAGNDLPDGRDFPNDTPAAGGIIIRVDNVTVFRYPMATYNGTVTDLTSIQTGPKDAAYWTDAVAAATALGGSLASGAPGCNAVFAPASWATLQWAHLIVEVNEQGQVTVVYKGSTLLDKQATSFFPSGGGIVLAGRTGGADEHAHFDNLTLTTTTVSGETQPPTVPGNLRGDVLGARRIVVAWDASVDAPNPNTPVAYEVERDGIVLAATVTATSYDDRANLAPTSSHTYRVRAKDPSGNMSAWASVTVSTVAEVAGTGWTLSRTYTNLSGAGMTDLLNAISDTSYPNNPGNVRYVRGITYGEPTFGDTYGDNNLVRIAGTITPPVSGQYRFFVRSDDASAFYLNRTGSAVPDPVAVFIEPDAQETDCCDAFQEPGVANDDTTTFPTSEPISLTAGTEYGFLYLVKEGGGGDWGQVAWRVEGDTTAAGSLPAISGVYLKPALGGDPVGASVTITTQPTNTTVIANEPLTLTAAYTATSPYTTTAVTQWYKDGKPILNATGTTLTIAVSKASDAGTYKFFASVPGAEASSTEVTVTVQTDTKAPTLVVGAAHGSSDFTHLDVRFSEPVTDPTAINAANYSITPAVAVTGAARVDAYTIRLTTAQQAINTLYTLTVNNVQDNAGNPVAPNSTVEWKSWLVVGSIVGTVKAEIYDGAGGATAGAISGTAVSALTSYAGYPASPDTTTNINAFDSRLYYPDDSHENFGARMTGIITVSETANYRFFITSDDASQLWLNKTGTTEAGLEKIAEETGCCNAFTEPDSARTSAFIPLTAGTQYLLRGIYKEGGGGDYMQIAWRKEGNPQPANTLRPIPGNVDPWAGAPAVTTQPNGAAVAPGGSATMSVAADLGARPLRYQWQIMSAQTTWTDIPGATDSSVTISNFDLSKVAGYRCVVSNAAGSAASRVVLLTLANTYVIEAEDFDYNGGQHVAAADTMPYTGFAYDGLSATYDVDYHNDNNDSITYRRGGDIAVAGHGVSMDNVTGNVLSVQRGGWTQVNNYKIGWIGTGDWHNYTRVIPAGTYNAFAALSFDGNGEHQLKAKLSRVTAGVGTTTQTLEDVGFFDQNGSRGWGQNNLVPMKDAAGAATATVTLPGGAVTLRMSHDSGDFDWFMLVPASAGGPKFDPIVIQPNGDVVITWSGGGTLQVAPAVNGPWTSVTGATSPFTWTPGTTTVQFARVISP